MTVTLEPPKAVVAEPPTEPSTFRFRPDVEGLRALGILLVVGFHATVPGMAGGYVGVDVFFVISGFLITGLLVREGLAEGRISLQEFYVRRARRILPAACIVIATTGVVLTFFVDPLREYRAVVDLGAALLYVANWRFINQGNDYLAASSDHSPALHFWSLSVEEQFYLAWPLLIVLSVVAARRWRWDLRVTAGAVLGLATAASLWASLVLTESDPTLAYMATWTRAWQFGAGGLLALLVTGGLASRLRSAGPVLPLVGVAGAAAVVGCAVVYDGSTAYPGAAALVPTLGTLAIIVAGYGDDRPRWSVSGALSWRSVRWLGRMSYAWYLWHWPVIVLVEARWPEVSLAGRVAAMLGALGLAYLTNRLVEVPMMTSRRFRRRRTSSYAAVALLTVLAGSTLAGTGQSVYSALNQPAPARQVPTFSQVFVQPERITEGTTSPTALRASEDVPQPHRCLTYETVDVPDDCVFGPEGGDDVVLFGDSHAEQWLTAFQLMAKEHNWRLHVVTQGSCSAADARPNIYGQMANDQSFCTDWRQAQFDEWKSLRPKYVFMSSSMPFLVNYDPTAAWARTFDAVRASGAQPVYIWDTPSPPIEVPECITGAVDDWDACGFSIADPEQAERFQAEAKAISFQDDLMSVNLTAGVLCQADWCPAVRDGVLLYRDHSHITDTVVRILEPELERRLAATGVELGGATSGSGPDD